MTTFTRKSLLAALKAVETPTKRPILGQQSYVFLSAKNGYASVESVNETLRYSANAAMEGVSDDAYHEPMAALIHAAHLINALSTASGDTVDLTIGTRLQIASGRFKAEVPILHTVDWFARVKRAVTARLECAGSELATAIKLAAPAAAEGEGFDQLKCVEFSVIGTKLAVCATNGRRICLDEINCTAKADFSFKLPVDVAAEIGTRSKDSASVVVAVSDTPASALFSFSDGSTIESALHSGNDLSFREGFGKAVTHQGAVVATAKVDRKRLSTALGYGCDVAGEKSEAVNMEITPEGMLTVSSKGVDGSFADEIDCLGSTNSGGMRINGGIVAGLLKNVTGESVDVDIYENGGAAMFNWGPQRIFAVGMMEV